MIKGNPWGLEQNISYDVELHRHVLSIASLLHIDHPLIPPQMHQHAPLRRPGDLHDMMITPVAQHDRLRCLLKGMAPNALTPAGLSVDRSRRGEEAGTQSSQPSSAGSTRARP